jgi:hypothetical protein
MNTDLYGLQPAYAATREIECEEGLRDSITTDQGYPAHQNSESSFLPASLKWIRIHLGSRMPSVMDAVKTALKYLFKKLYAFGIFAIEARSTAWPGISRFTVSKMLLLLPTKSNVYLH